MRTQRREGFTLIEFVVVLALSSLVMVEVLGLLQGQMYVNSAQKRSTNSQEDARMIADLILSDANTAGFMVPEIAAIASVDGGNSGADRLCVSDRDAIDETILGAATNRFDNASISGTLASSASQVTLVTADMDIDGDGNDDFVADSGIIISDGTRIHCARIQSISGNQIDFTPNTPNTFSVASPTARAVPAVIYELRTGELFRNSLTISTDVEDLQVEFAVDLDDDGEIDPGEFPIHVLDNNSPSLVRGVQLTVMTRTSEENENVQGAGRQAVANRNASGTPDGFRRRLVSVASALRNIL